MLEELLGYAANGAIGAAGAGLVLLNRGFWHVDKERGVHVANEKSLSAIIIRHFPNYRHISSPLDHFVEGMALPYIFGGIIGLVAVASQYLGDDSPLKLLLPEHVYPIGWGASAISKAAWQLTSAAMQRRGWDLNDYAQLAADAASLLVSGALIVKTYWA